MKSEHVEAKPSRIPRIFLAFFLVMLTLPSVDMAFKIDPTPARNENRALATFPKEYSNFPAFVKSFDLYFADNFGFRKLLISLYAKIKYLVFQTSPTENVLIGKEGWFFSALQKNVELYRNITPFEQSEIDEYVQILKERQAWSESIGAKYIFAVGPDSLTLNSEKLPDWVEKVNAGSRMDQLIEAGRSAGVEILDLRPALLEGKKLGMISYKTDTHWNSHGGGIAVKVIVDAIRKHHPELPDFDPYEDSSIESTHQPGLDLTNLMGLQDIVQESGQDLIYRGKKQFRQEERENLHFTTVNNDAIDFPMAFVCDSMAGNMMPHLGRHFSKVRFLWGYIFDDQEIARYSPKVVLNLVIERTLTLDWAKPENPPKVKNSFKKTNQ